MNIESFFDVWNYNRGNSENLAIQTNEIIAIVNDDFKDMITTSYEKGYLEGEKFGREDECLALRAKVISQLFTHSNFTDEDIFIIVGFQEENWRSYISDLRKKFEQGQEEGSTL